ncbi:MAG: xanthine dehydrogenase family protein molybdopterin-binding subunit [Candidatus Hydrogenedentota bacterium]
MAIGDSVIRKDAYEKVTGKSLYAADIKIHGMLYGGVVRSPYSASKIIKIDKNKALKIPGVVCVLTYEDIPGKNVVPLIKMDLPVLADKEARFAGEAVALVAATTIDALEQGIMNVEVSYKEIEPVIVPEEALKPKSRIVNPHFENNIISEYRIIKGKEIEDAFSECDYIVEDRYETPHQEHSYLEPQGMVAIPHPDGTMEVQGSMQCPFYVLDAVASVLSLPRAKVRIIQACVGGAFGGKEDVPSIVAAHTALLAYHTQKPMQIIYSRQEDMESTSKRHPGIIKYKSGIKKDGTLHAVKVEYILNGGAYATLSPVVMWRGNVHSVGPYRCPNVYVHTRAVCTNTVPNGAFRGFGTPQVIFAIESQMDRLAFKAGLSPLEIRLKNGLKIGDETATGHKLTESVGFIDTLKAASLEMDYEKKFEGYKSQNGRIRKGIGIGALIYGVGLGAGGKHLEKAGAFIQIHKDGSVQVAVGHTEMGQGFLTVVAQITAEALGVDYDRVHILPIDTSRVPDSGPTVASRATFISGKAILDAAAAMKERIFTQAAKLLNTKPENIEAKNGEIYLKSDNTQKISYDKVISECFANKIHLAASGWSEMSNTSYNMENGQGDAYFCYTFATNIAEVSVDMETGEVEVLKIASAYDLKPVNYQLTEGQIEGGVTQGLGYALMEGHLLKNGVIQNKDFSTYLIPTSKDVPKIKPIIIPNEYSMGPFGIKGFGETPLMAVAPAIVNAIYNATGKRITILPVTPEKILGHFTISNFQFLPR